MAVARFDVDPKRANGNQGFTLGRHTRLFAEGGNGAVCRFRTSVDVTLWPIEVTEVAYEAPGRYTFLDSDRDVAQVLRVRLVSGTEPFSDLQLDRLRLHLAGDPLVATRLYEMLLDSRLRVAVMSRGGAPHFLPPGSISATGFEEDEAILPYPVHSHPSYRLMQEYFAFPDKFHFVDIGNLGAARAAAGQELDLLFLLREAPQARLNLTTANFLLNCVPVVNLFEKTTEPIRIDHRRLEYRLVADARRETSTEIHSILSVSGTANAQDKTRQYEPFYVWSHELGRRVQRTFWHGRRVLSLYDHIVGTDMLLSFLDLDFNPQNPPAEVVWAHTLCTNRVLAAELPPGALLQADCDVPAAKIFCLKKPTQPVTPPIGGQTVWKLVSHLSLNYLSISDNDSSRHALQDILRLYAPNGSDALRQQINGISAVENRKVMRRMADGFCRGTEISLTLDPSEFVGGSAFLFAAVLNRFFALWASTNSFTQLVLRSRQRQEDWHRWPPMAGGKMHL